jgi:hypothetical protein
MTQPGSERLALLGRSLARWIVRAERSDALTGALGNPICCSRSFRSMRVAEGGRRLCGEVSKPQLLLRVMDAAIPQLCGGCRGLIVRAGVFITSNAWLMVLSISGPALSADEPPVRVPMSPADTRSDSKHDFVEVWVVLSEPALATLPREATEERGALRERILRQQNDVMAQLAALGATESGRTQQASNALAVRLPAAAIQSVKKIDGVIGVRPVSHRNRIAD